MFSYVQIRKLSTNLLNCAKTIPTNLKGKSKSSQEWLIRQFKDPYVEKANIMNYRCRSAFKLLEINEKHDILKPGNIVIDCGASPGSWSQIAVKETNADGSLGDDKPKGCVISIDLLQIHPIPGAIILNRMDFTKSTTQDKIKSILNGKNINTVLSDMAPSATGIRSLDQERIVELCYTVLRFAILTSSEGSNLLMKLWDNGDIMKLEKDILRFYKNCKRIKPKASRSDSAEMFLLAKNFYGIEREKIN